jgi:hypothetical protein
MAPAPAVMVVTAVMVMMVMPALRNGPRAGPPRRRRRGHGVVVPALAARVGGAGLRARADDPPYQQDADDGADHDAGYGAAVEARVGG